MMKRFTVQIALLLVAVAGLSEPALAGDGGADARFEAMLKGIESAPDRAALDASFEDARARLLKVALDEGRDTWSRLRAITMAGLYPDKGVRAVLTDLSRHKAPDIRRRALYVVGRAFGKKADLALVKLLTAAVRDPVPDVHPMAVRGLGWIDHPAAEKALEGLTAGPDAKLAHLARYVIKRHAARKAVAKPQPSEPASGR